MSDHTLLAACGACYHYRASTAEGRHLLAEAERRGRSTDGYACRGCRSESLYAHPGCVECAIRACANTCSILHCEQCNRFPCERIRAFQGDGRVHHLPVLEQLADLARKDPGHWLVEQTGRWSCIQLVRDDVRTVRRAARPLRPRPDDRYLAEVPT